MQQRARRNKAFWFLLFDSGSITYTELSHMDMAEYYECLAAKEMYVDMLKAK